MTDTKLSPAEQLADIVACASMGSASFHLGGLPPMIYTDGVQAFAETFGAYWLIDVIASHQPEIAREFSTPKMHTPEGGGPEDATPQSKHFQVWRVVEHPHTTRCPDGVRVECWGDTPDKSLRMVQQDIEWSDLSRELLPLEVFWVEYGDGGRGKSEPVLMLKTER